MNQQDILYKVDHTLLAQTATWEEIKEICEDAVKFHTASVCIPPSFVRQAAEYLEGSMTVCTVIGFPNGYSTTAVKVFETVDAINNGARESIWLSISAGRRPDCMISSGMKSGK